MRAGCDINISAMDGHGRARRKQEDGILNLAPDLRDALKEIGATWEVLWGMDWVMLVWYVMCGRERGIERV